MLVIYNANADYAEANGVHEEQNQDDNLDVHVANGGGGDGNGDGYEGDANVGMVIYRYQLEYEMRHIRLLQVLTTSIFANQCHDWNALSERIFQRCRLSMGNVDFVIPNC